MLLAIGFVVLALICSAFTQIDQAQKVKDQEEANRKAEEFYRNRDKNN